VVSIGKSGTKFYRLIIIRERVGANVRELQSRGLLDPSPSRGGVPKAAIQQVEEMFRKVRHGGDPETLKRELDRWGLFEYYEERFLNLFRR
jgi:hypothetical protein